MSSGEELETVVEVWVTRFRECVAGGVEELGCCSIW